MNPWPDIPPDPYRNEHVVLLVYERARYEAAMERLREAEKALQVLAAQWSGKAGSTARSDCMAVIAKNALATIGELPDVREG